MEKELSLSQEQLQEFVLHRKYLRNLHSDSFELDVEFEDEEHDYDEAYNCK